MAQTVFLTGATGFVGGDFLNRLILRNPDLRAFCLIRARDAAHLEARRQKLLAYAGIEGPDGDRVIAVAGDVVEADLGMGDRYREIFGASRNPPESDETAREL